MQKFYQYTSCRLAELRDVVVDIRGKHDLEVQERRTLEQQIQAR